MLILKTNFSKGRSTYKVVRASCLFNVGVKVTTLNGMKLASIYFFEVAVDCEEVLCRSQ